MQTLRSNVTYNTIKVEKYSLESHILSNFSISRISLYKKFVLSIHGAFTRQNIPFKIDFQALWQLDMMLKHSHEKNNVHRCYFVNNGNKVWSLYMNIVAVSNYFLHIVLCIHVNWCTEFQLPGMVYPFLCRESFFCTTCAY